METPVFYISLLIACVGYLWVLILAVREAYYESRRADYLERSNRELHAENNNLRSQIK